MLRKILSKLTGRALAADQQGSTLIEMAIVLPTFFMVLFGIFQFAEMGFGYCNATYAARRAVRYASLHSTTSLQPASTTVVSAIAKPFLTGSGASAAPTIAVAYGGTNTVGGTVTVTISLKYNLMIPYAKLNPINVQGYAQRVITR
jgi:Flp pilus assembly protein TadG